ncbi:BRO-N domain-containing protein [Acinetobacter bereziniae]|uniref:BRO-N domain-containing protein n=1 Tax=Acinetobacter bereziniae TaxID=106648 RepID=UPI0012500B8A|nr:BRO family protein [Acinetobacter bereziniae]
MTSLALSFNEVKFNPVQHDKQIWLTASELAKALGYAKSDAVAQIYERNKDEFNDSMTTTLKLSVVRKTGSVEMDNRIFSLRGCHLVTFFARTKVAKQFRKWVLDILDNEVGQQVAKTNKSDREPLTNAVNLLVAKTKHLNYSDAYKLVHQRFNVKHIDEIPYDEIPVAVEYVHHLIALYSNADKKQFNASDIHNLHALATHMILVREWWREFGSSIKKLNPAVHTTITDNFTDGSFLAWNYIKPDQKQALINHINTLNWLNEPYQQKLVI